MRQAFASAIVAVASVLATGSAHADLVLNFNGTDNYGGVMLSGGRLFHETAGGNGYLVLEDGPLTALELEVPLTPVIGQWDSWSQYFGGTLSFDVLALSDVQSVSPSFGQITLTKLFSGGQSISVDVVPETAISSNGWTTYSIALTPEAGWGTSLSDVLASPQRVVINFETGSSDTNRSMIGVDNIRVTSAVPEPSTGLMGLMGLSLLGLALRRFAGRGR